MLELQHHGIKGMKWGVQRYQNADGSLTPAGKKRQEKERKKIDKIASRKDHGFGINQNMVLSRINYERTQDKTFAKKWGDAFSAGEGTKEWAEYEKYAKDFVNKYADIYTDAFIADNHLKRVSDAGRNYIKELVKAK